MEEAGVEGRDEIRRGELTRALFKVAWRDPRWSETSGVATDLTEKHVRETGLASGLVDVKVCAVDETWSALKFVYRLTER